MSLRVILVALSMFRHCHVLTSHRLRTNREKEHLDFDFRSKP